MKAPASHRPAIGYLVACAFVSACVRARACACVCVCVRACVRSCACARSRACVRACKCLFGLGRITLPRDPFYFLAVVCPLVHAGAYALVHAGSGARHMAFGHTCVWATCVASLPPACPHISRRDQARRPLVSALSPSVTHLHLYVSPRR